MNGARIRIRIKAADAMIATAIHLQKSLAESRTHNALQIGRIAENSCTPTLNRGILPYGSGQVARADSVKPPERDARETSSVKSGAFGVRGESICERSWQS